MSEKLLRAICRRHHGSDTPVFHLSDWSWAIVVTSFIGFAVEDIWLLITKGYANNRNMFLPFLLGYGLACFGVWLLFGTPADRRGLIRIKDGGNMRRRVLGYILMVFVFVCIAEIILGCSVERSCGFYYWNYENLPLHITRYTSVFTSLGFSSIIALFMQYVFGPLMAFVRRFDSKPFRIAGIIMLALLVADYLASFGYMIINKDYHIVWWVSIRS